MVGTREGPQLDVGPVLKALLALHITYFQFQKLRFHTISCRFCDFTRSLDSSINQHRIRLRGSTSGPVVGLAPVNGAPGARCSRAAQLPLLLAHVRALALRPC